MNRKESHPAFLQTDHRPWPLPEKRWVVKQVWKDLLFIHWEIDPEKIRPLIPSELELDLFDGKAWIGVVPFDMSGVTRRGFPAPKWMCDFPEINVRTYVTHQGKPGVWFFSLDVPNPFAVWAARTFYHLPYYKADMRIEPSGNGFTYQHQRGDYRFKGSYEGLERLHCEKGSFELWATERYCLYSQSQGGTLYRAEIHHPQWPLQKARFSIDENTLLQDFRVGALSSVALFSKSIDVIVYPMDRLT